MRGTPNGRLLYAWKRKSEAALKPISRYPTGKRSSWAEIVAFD